MRLPSSLLAALLTFALGALPASAAETALLCGGTLDNEASRRELAESLGLEYVVNRVGGYRRATTPRVVEKLVAVKGAPKGEKVLKESLVYDIQYFDEANALVTDPTVVAYLDSLRVPGEFSDVWYSANREAHLLAVGLDTKGRRQGTYHPTWLVARTEKKFDKIREFGSALVGARPKMYADLRGPGMSKEKLLAAVAAILESGAIRVGSRKYAEENGTYGLTTLLREHVVVEGAFVHFDFVGKKSVGHQFTMELPEIAPIIADRLRSQASPTVFHYVDARGVVRTLSGQDVKKYMMAAFGGNFTAKNFRTWKATTEAAKKLLEFGPARTAKEIEEHVKQAIEYAAGKLRNEPATCRDNYIFPGVLRIYEDVAAFEALVKKVGSEKIPDGMTREEAFVLALMRAGDH